MAHNFLEEWDRKMARVIMTIVAQIGLGWLAYLITHKWVVVFAGALLPALMYLAVRLREAVFRRKALMILIAGTFTCVLGGFVVAVRLYFGPTVRMLGDYLLTITK